MVYVIFVVTNDVQELFMIDNEDKILASIPKHNFFFSLKFTFTIVLLLKNTLLFSRSYKFNIVSKFNCKCPEPGCSKAN